MENTTDRSLFKSDAKQIVDVLFDNKMFKEALTRDDINAVEDLLTYMMDSRYDCQKKAENLKTKIQIQEQKQTLK